jgi:hypothetical protein
MATKTKTSGSPRRSRPKAAPSTVLTWETDPLDGTPISRATPNVSQGPLPFAFPKAPAPAAEYPRGTEPFRYWATAEALRRGADFWARIAGLSRWEEGPTLEVRLDVEEDLNANYSRDALNFFHGPGANGTIVYSAESPDVACHELGHAVLDALKPELWDAASQEVAAFHEAMGDISAFLCAIQLPSLRTAILQTTGGRYRSSRLSRMAEQLGAAIRAQRPDMVEPDCLRNAVNSFTYRPPSGLPTRTPASQLSSEAHNFSRVFSGAALEILAELTAARAKGSSPAEADLLAAGDDLATILVRAIRNAPVVSNWYAQVAAAMVQESRHVDAAFPALLKAVFVRRAILSLHSAATLHLFAAAADASVADSAGAARPLADLALPADHYGLDRPLLVRSASHPRPFAAMAMVGNESVAPESGSEAARAFVDDLFRRGRVNYDGEGREEAVLNHPHRRKSHRLTKAESGYRLHRLLFDCGFCD